MKYLIFGDIHGQYDRLVGILDEFFDGAEKVIFLGDYIDKNKEALKTLRCVLKLKKDNPDKVELLWGNHDIFMLNSLVYHDKKMFNLWFNINRAFETTFFDDVPGNDRVLFRTGYGEFVEEYHEKFKIDKPLINSAKELLDLGKLYYKDKRIFCIHGGLPINVINRKSFKMLPFYNLEGEQGLQKLEGDYKSGYVSAINFFSKTLKEDPVWFNGASTYERITKEAFDDLLNILEVKEIYVGHRKGITQPKFPKGDIFKTLNLGHSDIGFFYGDVK